MGRLKGHMVYRVVSTEFLPLRERALHDPDEDTYLTYLKTLLKNGPMYFSYSLDITNSFQRQAEADLSQPLWQRADDRFFWNRFVQSDLIDMANGKGSASGLRGSPQPGADPFILPIMFGMMRIAATSVKYTPFTFSLITRRSRHRAGTRYLTRGIDEQGHVANYNETEQVVILNDTTGGLGGFGGAQNGSVEYDGTETQIMSYVQTRGSIPVYWAEINNLHYRPDLEIRGVESAVNAAKIHFDEQIDFYGENYLVNLVNQQGREEKPKKAYEQIVRLLMSSPDEAIKANSVTPEKLRVVESTQSHHKYDKLHYIYFDFHNETKGLRWHRATLLLDQLKSALWAGQYFRGIPIPTSNAGALEVRLRQTAVVRTNCMDCLDRTNVIQTMLARWTLTRQLLDAGILKPGETADDDATFASFFRNIWADNADVVSKAYSGTGALKTDFTRTGERTRSGALQDLNNSITRYVKNNFGDGPRQDAYDLFHGTFVPPPAGTGSVFADKRPVMVQAVPYVMLACLFFVLVAGMTRTSPETTVWPLRLVACICMVVGAWCGRFVWVHGMLYVSLPWVGGSEYDGQTNRGFLGKLAQTQHPSLRHRGHTGEHGSCTGRSANRRVREQT